MIVKSPNKITLTYYKLNMNVKGQWKTKERDGWTYSISREISVNLLRAGSPGLKGRSLLSSGTLKQAK